MVTQELAAQGNLLNVKMPALAQANAALSAAHAWARAAAQATPPANTRAPYSKRATLAQVRPLRPPLSQTSPLPMSPKSPRRSKAACLPVYLAWVSHADVLKGFANHPSTTLGSFV